MSPTATGGHPHTRAASANGDGPVSTTNGVKMNSVEGMKGANRMFPHLDDLVAAKPDVDIHSTIRKILQEGESLAKQADTHLDFRRLDMALQEYVKASIIAIEIIPRHKDYPSLQTDRGDLHRSYHGLTKRINSQHQKFAEVKTIIQENNLRSGVKPAISRESSLSGPSFKSNGSQPGPGRSQTKQSPMNEELLNGSPARKKPPIQPKPNALHGKAIQSSHSNSASDLAARFARLRGPEIDVVQDPRIRTRPIPISQTAAPAGVTPIKSSIDMNRASARDMPSVPSSFTPSKVIPPTKLPLAMMANWNKSTPLQTNLPGFPQPPDPIYSPDRNAPPHGIVDMPSSVPRSSSFHGAAPPISTVGPTTGITDGRLDYFVAAHTVDSANNLPPRKRNIDLPDTTQVTAEELMGYLRQGTRNLRVLLVDVRSRSDFENGHILSQSIICVEPITLEEGISGEQLEDRMVIASDFEQSLYYTRDDFDLVVFYDQSSTSVKSSSGPASASALQHFEKAVYEYGYDKCLKRRPMLLVGGLDSWVDLLGPNSLQSSSGTPSTGTQKVARPLGRVPMAREMNKASIKRRKTHSSRPLTKEEEGEWDQRLREDASLGNALNETDTSALDVNIVRSTEDFFRRFPELPPIQESMISPATSPGPSKSYQEHIYSSIPPPPARPAPALPRQRSAGILEKGPSATHAHSTGIDSITDTPVVPGVTGLGNPGVLCYMNGAVQGLSATQFLRDLLMSGPFPQKHIPKKAEEAGDPPQLMVRSLGNLIGHLWSGQFDYVTPKTFANYVNNVHAPKLQDAVRNEAFGGSRRQHDSAEFLSFLLDILDDELNPRRNVPAFKEDDAWTQKLNKIDGLSACEEWWNRFLTREASPITTNMKGQVVTVTECESCKNKTKRFDPFTALVVPILDAESQTLDDAIQRTWGPRSIERIEGYRCDLCNENRVARRTQFFSRLPDYLILQISRYDNQLQKIKTKLKFRETGFDITPSFMPSPANEPSSPRPRQQTGPFLYDPYAVEIHSGNSIRVGHYFTFVKSDVRGQIGSSAGAPTSWTEFNDRIVRPKSFQHTQNLDAAQIFLKRQGA